jgi:hypothetical protein
LSRARLDRLVERDTTAMRALEAVRDVGPIGAYIAAGFIRNRYWDSLYAPAPVATPSDTDVVYFDRDYSLKTRDMAYEASLRLAAPGTDWQVRNQARMHAFCGFPPFVSLEDGLRHWAETATGIGVRLTRGGALEWTSAFGFDDLFGHILRITPATKTNDPEGFEARLKAKGWLRRWPNLTIVRE